MLIVTTQQSAPPVTLKDPPRPSRPLQRMASLAKASSSQKSGTTSPRSRAQPLQRNSAFSFRVDPQSPVRLFATNFIPEPDALLGDMSHSLNEPGYLSRLRVEQSGDSASGRAATDKYPSVHSARVATFRPRASTSNASARDFIHSAI